MYFALRENWWGEEYLYKGEVRYSSRGAEPIKLRWAGRAADATYGTGITYSFRPFVGKVQRETAAWETYACIKIVIIGEDARVRVGFIRLRLSFSVKFSLNTVMCL
jgi:hypothetical protein